MHSVLIVDDEVDACENLRDILSDLGYRVGIARSGPEAVAQVVRSPYDIALLDLKMPGMDGVTVYRQIKRLSPGDGCHRRLCLFGKRARGTCGRRRGGPGRRETRSREFAEQSDSSPELHERAFRPLLPGEVSNR